MRNLMLVARAEYRNQVKRRSFLLATLGVPLLIGVVMAISIFASMGTSDDRPFGYVDRAGFMQGVDLSPYGGLDAVSYPGVEAAQTALANGDIQAYYVVPADYRQTQRITQYYWDKAPQPGVGGQFRSMLRASLLASQPAEVRSALERGVSITTRSISGGAESETDQILGLLLPLFVGMFFVFVVMGSAGYLLQAVTTEKENRMVEVMFTTVSPGQLIGGKSIGLMGVALTQIVIWLVALLAGVLILSRYVDFLSGITIDARFLLLVALYFLPTYALVAGMMITLGSMVTEIQQGQQIAGVVNMLFVVPFFFFVLVFTNPDSPILIAMTLFPTTSFMAVAMRWGVTTIPFWQLGLGWLLLVASSIFMIWVAGRVFRIGMLRYGQPLSLRTVWHIGVQRQVS